MSTEPKLEDLPVAEVYMDDLATGWTIRKLIMVGVFIVFVDALTLGGLFLLVRGMLCQ